MTSGRGENPQFDHLLHWVPDVPDAVEAYRAVGLPAHAHAEQHGLRNGGWRLDERYVEIVTVVDEAVAARSPVAEALRCLRPAIDALPGPGGGITFAVDVTDAAATAARLRDQGFRTAECQVGAPGHGASFLEVFVLDVAPWVPFFITYTPPRAELLAGVDPAAFERGAHDLTDLVIEVPDPAAAADLLATLTGLPAERDEPAVALPGARVGFVAGPRDGIVAVGLSGPPLAPTDIQGLVYRSPV